MTKPICALIATLAVATVLGAAAGPAPSFRPDPLWSQALPNKWVTGAVGGMAVDSHDNVWVFHREASIPDGEKAASLKPPQAECCIPAPAVLRVQPRRAVPPGVGRARARAMSGSPRSTGSSSTRRTTSG